MGVEIILAFNEAAFKEPTDQPCIWFFYHEVNLDRQPRVRSQLAQPADPVERLNAGGEPPIDDINMEGIRTSLFSLRDFLQHPCLAGTKDRETQLRFCLAF